MDRRKILSGVLVAELAGLALGLPQCGGRSGLLEGFEAAGGGSSGTGSASSTGSTGSGSATSSTRDGGVTACPICSADGWCWTNPLPQGNGLSSIWGSSPSDVWAGGDALLHWDGTQWCPAGGNFPPVYALWGDASDDVWGVEVGPQGGQVAHWDGTSWSTAYTPPSGLGLTAVGGSGPSDVWVAGSYETSGGQALVIAVVHFDGSAWTQSSVPTVRGDSPVLWSNGPSDVWVGAGSEDDIGATAMLHFDGSVWTAVPVPLVSGLSAVWGSGPSDMWATGAPTLPGMGSIVVHWDGAAWTQSFASPAYLSAISGTGPGDVWVLGNPEETVAPGTIGGVVEHWDGAAWSETPVATFPQNAFGNLGLWIAPGSDDLWAVGSDGILARGTAGALASQTTSVTYANLLSVSADAPDDAWAVGAYPIYTDAQEPLPVVIHWDGSAWSPSSLPAGMKGSIISVWASGPDDVWCANEPWGDGPSLLHWDGQAWSPTTLPAMAQVYALSGTATDDVWAVGGTADGAVAFHWDGSNWSLEETVGNPEDEDPGDAAFFAVWAGSPSDVWAVGLTGLISHWDGTSWSTITTGDTQNLEAVWGSGPDDVWILDQAGAVLRGNASGLSPVQTPAMGGNGAFSMWGSGPNDVWILAASEDVTTLLHWDGNGFSVSDGAGADELNAVGGSGAGDVWLVGSDGVVLHHG